MIQWVCLTFISLNVSTHARVAADPCVPWESEIRTRRASELSGRAFRQLLDCSRRRCHNVLRCINAVLHKGKTWRAATSGQKAIDKSEAYVGEMFQVWAVEVKALDRSKGLVGRTEEQETRPAGSEIVVNDDNYLQAVDGRCQRRSACSTALEAGNARIGEAAG